MKPHPKKSLGQHFLADTNYCHKIVRFAHVGPGETVVEIGPGTGQLTKVLLATAKRVIAIEFDAYMVRHLQTELLENLNDPQHQLQLLQADVLNLDWDSVLGPTPIRIIGNLPYNISTRILSNLLTVKNRLVDCTVMVQKEVAQRILANPCSSDYGFFTLLMEYHFQRVPGFDVPAGVFVPKPKVMSSVIKLIPQSPPHPVSDYAAFLELLKIAFQQRRKTLFNNLKSWHQAASLSLALESCDIDARARPQEVTLKQFVCLAEHLTS